jgi:pimeloyl-ACP methyl ester carboxylesterase
LFAFYDLMVSMTNMGVPNRSINVNDSRENSASKMLAFSRYLQATCLSLLFGLSTAWAQSHLNGASGQLFKPDLEEGSFEFLTKTEYDPKSDIGKSRFTVHWSEDVEIIRIGELKDFSTIPGSINATFRGITKVDAEAQAAGKPFVARVATLFEGIDPVETENPSNEVTGVFRPNPDGSRAGTIKVDTRAVKVSLRNRNWRIFHHKRIQPIDLTKGFWSVTVRGAEDDSGRFVAERLEVQPLPDQRLMDNPELPRVLVIGDSISMNYHDAAKEALAGVANYHRIEGNGFSVIHGVNNAELWLGNYHEKGFQWDVILFNHGLHDLKQSYDEATDTFGAYAVSLDDYKSNLEKLIGILKKTEATLVWTSTTPVPNDRKGKYARRKGAPEIFNAAAMEVMQRHPEIIINNLCGVVGGSPVFDEWRKGDDVHFYKEEERNLIGEAVASAVRQALALRAEKPKKKLPLPGEVFQVEGCTAFLIRPKGVRAACSGPQSWVWYAPTLARYPAKTERWMFEQFLSAGIAVAGIDVGESMGNPEGRRLFSALYDELTLKLGLAEKPVLLARSRGGLMLYNWAAENPNKVAAIAGIYPVGNLASWPGLEKASKAYGVDAAVLGEQLAKHNPVDRLALIAQASVPILHLHGDNDTVVRLKENSGLLYERYQELGGLMQLVVIPGGGHDLEKHWFQSQALVDFVITHAK